MTDLIYDNVITAIKKLQILRVNITSLYADLESGSIRNCFDEHETDELNNVLIPSVKKRLEKIGQSFLDFEKYLATLPPPPLPLTPGPTSLLALDPTLDQSQVSQHVIQTYKWMAKLHEQSAHAYNYISMRASKKSMYNSSMKKNKKSNVGYFNASPQQLEGFASYFQRYPGLTLNIIKSSCANPLMFEITVGQVLRALIVIKGTIVENVVIKSFNEDLKNKETGKYNHDSLSKYEVFRKINEHARCTILSNNSNNSDVRPFVAWLHGYKNLFTAPCSKCNKLLLDFQLPTVRDFRSCEACHVSCCHS